MLFCISIVVWCGGIVRKPLFILRSGGIIFTFFARKFGSLIIVRIFGQTKEQNTMSAKTIVKIGDEYTVQFSYSDGYTSSTLIKKSWKTRKGAEKWLENYNKIK